MGDGFTWRDGERTIRFGRGAVAGAGELLGEGFCLLTTPRAEAAAPGLVAAASTVHYVGHWASSTNWRATCCPRRSV